MSKLIITLIFAVICLQPLHASAARTESDSKNSIVSFMNLSKFTKVTPKSQKFEVSGRIILLPTCPLIYSNTGPEQCAPKGLHTQLVVKDQKNRAVQKFNSDRIGYFITKLPVGKYTITTTDLHKYPFAKPISFEVKADQKNYLTVRVYSVIQ